MFKAINRWLEQRERNNSVKINDIVEVEIASDVWRQAIVLNFHPNGHVYIQFGNGVTNWVARNAIRAIF